jgi:hypothetical protein
VKGWLTLFLLTLSFAFAEDFSIYPLTPAPLEFGAQLELELDGLLESPSLKFPATLEPLSMQYVYPDKATLYSMQFVEPDPTTEFSMYTPEATAHPDFELEFLNP